MTTYQLLQLLAGFIYIGLHFALCRKVGYSVGKSAWLGIGLAIPFVGIGFLLYLVSTSWPLEQQVRSLRGQAGIGSAEDAFGLLEEAGRLERRGDIPAALSKYEEVRSRFPNTDASKDAEASIRSLHEKRK